MLGEQARAQLLQTFEQELQEYCQVLNRALLQLEKEPSVDEQRTYLDEAFRAAHSAKGGARAVGLVDVEALTHGLEEVLGALRRGQRELSPAVFDQLYAAVDMLIAVADTGGQAQDGEAVRLLLAQLAAGTNGGMPAPARKPPEHSVAANAPEPVRAASDRQTPAASAETVRVTAARLDELLDLLGELVVPRLEGAEAIKALRGLREDLERWQQAWWGLGPMARQVTLDQFATGKAAAPATQQLFKFLEYNAASLSRFDAALADLETRLTSTTEQIGDLTTALQANVKHLRMVPFGQLTDRLERVVRDLLRGADKEVRLMLIGSDTELDRHVLEQMKDPLMHLLRNAIDHGIEPTSERQQRGKPVTGRVVVAAAQRGGTIEIEVEDDGTGLDPAAIRRVAVERGVVSPSEVATLPDSELMRLIFLPGFSTRSEVNQFSGRGVGLDVVARSVEQLGGQIDINSTPGQGTSLIMRLPLTLATMRAVLVEIATHWYALPTAVIERLIRLDPEQHMLGSLGGRPVLNYDGAAIPLVVFTDLVPSPATPAASNGHAPTILALVAVGAQRIALAIDRVIDEQEIVVKPLGYPLLRVPYFAGATILGTGKVVPILHAGDLVHAGTRARIKRGLPVADEAAHARQASSEARRVRILVADDSLTARTLERYILEGAGYDVDLAPDGAEALALLQQQTYDLLVSDIDMPHIDGIELTTRIRAVPELSNLPVILVTSLASPEDRERGLQAGADAYIVKSGFDQDHLLRTIREIL